MLFFFNLGGNICKINEIIILIEKNFFVLCNKIIKVYLKCKCKFKIDCGIIYKILKKFW